MRSALLGEYAIGLHMWSQGVLETSASTNSNSWFGISFGCYISSHYHAQLWYRTEYNFGGFNDCICAFLFECTVVRWKFAMHALPLHGLHGGLLCGIQ